MKMLSSVKIMYKNDLFITMLILLLCINPLLSQGSIDTSSNTTHFLVSNAEEFCIKFMMSPDATNGTTITLEIGNLLLTGTGLSVVSLKMSGPGGWEWEISSLTNGNYSPSSNPTGKNVELEVISPQININIDHVFAGTDEEWYLAIKNLGSSGDTEGELTTGTGMVGQFTDIYLKPEVNAGSDFTIDEGASKAMSASLINPHRHRNIVSGTWDDGIVYFWNSTDFAPQDALITIYTAPYVGADVTDTFTLTATAGLLDSTDDIVITVRNIPEPFEVMIVLDHSGSMVGYKWDAAVQASNQFIEFLQEYEANFSSPKDKYGAVSFTCSFKDYWWLCQCIPGGPPADQIEIRHLADPPPTSVNVNIESFFPTQPFNYTPIGDGLNAAREEFMSLNTANRKIFLLLTDGIENAGYRCINEFWNDLQNSAVTPNESIRNAKIYTIGLGSDEDIRPERIAQLAFDSDGDYRITEEAFILPEFFSQILGSEVDFQQVAPNSDGTYPISEAKAAFIIVWNRTIDGPGPYWPKIQGGNCGVSIDINNVSNYGNVRKSIQLPNDSYSFFIATDAPCDLTPPDLSFDLDGPPWAVSITNSSGIAATPSSAHIYVIEDLNLMANFYFDHNIHYTGDKIVLQAELRDGLTPINGKTADVFVDVVKPGEALGEILSTYPGSSSPGSITGIIKDKQTGETLPGLNLVLEGTTIGGVTDSKGRYKIQNVPAGVYNLVINVPGKEKFVTQIPVFGNHSMEINFTIADILSQSMVNNLPLDVTSVRAIHWKEAFKFLGRDSLIRQYDRIWLNDKGLHGDKRANDGVFTYEFSNTDVEGTYTFKFTAQGKNTKGESFSRTKTISEYVYIGSSSPNTVTNFEIMDNSQLLKKGYRLANVSFTPRDFFKNALGPYRGDLIRMQSNMGEFEGGLVDHLNGTYSQVLKFKENTKPTVQPFIRGIKIDKTINIQAPVLFDRFELQPFIGKFIFDDHFKLDDVLLYGNDIGLNLTKNWGIKFSGGYSTTKDSVKKNGNILVLNGNIVYNFRMLSYQRILPSLTGGIGFLNFNEFTTSDQVLAYNIGAGVGYTISEILKLQVQVNDYIAGSNNFSSATTHNILTRFGIMLSF